jgi:hypothetical protein
MGNSSVSFDGIIIEADFVYSRHFSIFYRILRRICRHVEEMGIAYWASLIHR